MGFTSFSLDRGPDFCAAAAVARYGEDVRHEETAAAIQAINAIIRSVQELVIVQKKALQDQRLLIEDKAMRHGIPLAFPSANHHTFT